MEFIVLIPVSYTHLDVYKRQAHHGLRPGGGHHQIAGPVRQGIAHVPQVTGLVHILYLGVGQSGDAVGAPVDVYKRQSFVCTA